MKDAPIQGSPSPSNVLRDGPLPSKPGPPIVEHVEARDVVLRALFEIRDPEIPPLSIVEMGMVHSIDVAHDRVRVQWLPTFAGCPALAVIGAQIESAIRDLGYESVDVEAVFDPPWSTDRITPDGRRKLREFGLSPPPRLDGAFVSLEMLHKAPCPQCGSRDTTLESPFGPTLCRAIHFCRACKNSFEQFKPL